MSIHNNLKNEMCARGKHLELVCGLLRFGNVSEHVFMLQDLLTALLHMWSAFIIFIVGQK